MKNVVYTATTEEPEIKKLQRMYYDMKNPTPRNRAERRKQEREKKKRRNK